VSAKKDNLRPPSKPAASGDDAKRRRIGLIVRDDRDTAHIEWVDAPNDYTRVPLSIEGAPPPGSNPPQAGYDPYETISPTKNRTEANKKPVKRDLHKLSAWIKQMRELEERKKRGED
jgi:hypothetical protein